MAAGDRDNVTFEMEFGDGVYVPVTDAVVRAIPAMVDTELKRVLLRVANRMAEMLRDRYADVIRSRPRTEGRSLRDRVLDAITAGVALRVGEIDVGVFDLGKVERQTQDEGAGDRSLFEIMEEGYDTAMPYGFVPLPAAVHLAEACAAAFDLKDEQRAAFVAHVREVFAGRHGEGIMVNVFAPLFFWFPDFGTAFEHGFLPHGGWDGWNVLTQIDGPLGARAAAKAGGQNWILLVLEEGFAAAGKRLKALAG